MDESTAHKLVYGENEDEGPEDEFSTPYPKTVYRCLLGICRSIDRLEGPQVFTLPGIELFAIVSHPGDDDLVEQLEYVFGRWGIWVKQYSSGNIRFWLQRPATGGPYKDKINKLFTL